MAYDEEDEADLAARGNFLFRGGGFFQKKLPELPELVFEGKSPNSPRSRLLKAATTVKCSRLARLLN